MPDEIGLLSNIHQDFIAFGSSAVDVSDNILAGRPYGWYGNTLSKLHCFCCENSW